MQSKRKWTEQSFTFYSDAIVDESSDWCHVHCSLDFLSLKSNNGMDNGYVTPLDKFYESFLISMMIISEMQKVSSEKSLTLYRLNFNAPAIKFTMDGKLPYLKDGKFTIYI